MDIYTIAFEADIPAVGYITYNYVAKNIEWPDFGQYSYKDFYPPYRIIGSMKTGYNQWDNCELKITVNVNGTLSILDKVSGKKFNDLLLFEDGGDKGDGWNYRAPLHDTVVSGITANAVLSVESSGPLVTRLRVDTNLMLSSELRRDKMGRSDDVKQMRLKTYIDIKVSEGIIYLSKRANRAFRLDLKEEILEQVSSGNEITLKASPKEIITLGIQF